MTTPPQDGAHLSARLSGPVAEVGAGPEGPGVGAFFDLDGTLVAGYTAAAQTRDRVRRRDLRMAEYLTIVQLAVRFRLGRHAFETLIEGSARTVKGRLARDVDEMGERIFRQDVSNTSVGEMIGQVAEDLSLPMRHELDLAKARLSRKSPRPTRRPACSAGPASLAT